MGAPILRAARSSRHARNKRRSLTHLPAPSPIGQEEKKEILAEWLLQFSDNVRVWVRKAADGVLDKFLDENQIVADHKMTFMQRAAMRTECRKLVKYIRLCDFIVRDTLLSLALESIESMLHFFVNAMESATGEKSYTDQEKDEEEYGHAPPLEFSDGTVVPRLQVGVNFSESGNIVFSPSAPNCVSQVEGVMFDAVRVIAAPEALLTHDDLKMYTEAAAEDIDDQSFMQKIKLDHEVRANQIFLKDTKRIRSIIEGNYDKASQLFVFVLDLSGTLSPPFPLISLFRPP